VGEFAINYPAGKHFLSRLDYWMERFRGSSGKRWVPEGSAIGNNMPSRIAIYPYKLQKERLRGNGKQAAT